MTYLPPAAPHLGAVIGCTPLVRLPYLSKRTGLTVWAKLEGFNPGGSAKDRTAAALVENALSSGRLRPGGTVVESSSGNLGMALARECCLRGMSFHCVVDPRTNRYAASVMEALGATVHRVTEPDPATGDWLAARRNRVRDLLEELPGSVNLDQYSNRAVFPAHARGTMREIVEQLGHAPAHLFAAVSTTGTLGGCLEYLRGTRAATRVTAVDATGSVLYGGCRGERPLPGFGAGVVPELSTQSQPHSVARINAARAVAGARLVARREAYLPGASGGAVVAALLGAASPADPAADSPENDAVLIFHDHGYAYLDTVYSDAWVREHLGDPSELENTL
ncbi:pyridoxal-phosphate dependent enzyme [Corynebacterium mastitidis]|uniref:pyridoxal-phosphate dependent enzyme n=1 Tax=Corynebacterium mastitidis TaxID=161890 RepID=UPI000476AB9F|nr:pyridoxal-phosphate dependent enzyme [Corynebacterium mastitidis]